MSVCNICPRQCNTDRDRQVGYCGMNNTVKVSRAALHFWEEPCISGDTGSGTVFFSGCNLKCVFCQNKDISHDGFGKEITTEHLADIFLKLQAQGALNINLVTPTHYTDQIITALKIAKQNGLILPIVYNTSCYEKVDTLKKLDGLVDIYLPDFKYYDDAVAVKYSKADGYAQIAKDALSEMYRQIGKAQFNASGIMQKGIIVRHLILPGQTDGAKRVIEYLYKAYGDDIFISIMSQYTPFGDLTRYPEIDRTLTEAEYNSVVDFAVDLGVENAFVQEGEAASESFIPPFNLEGVD